MYRTARADLRSNRWRYIVLSYMLTNTITIAMSCIYSGKVFVSITDHIILGHPYIQSLLALW